MVVVQHAVADATNGSLCRPVAGSAIEHLLVGGRHGVGLRAADADHAVDRIDARRLGHCHQYLGGDIRAVFGRPVDLRAVPRRQRRDCRRPGIVFWQLGGGAHGGVGRQHRGGLGRPDHHAVLSPLMTTPYNNVGVLSATSAGTGTLTLGSAVNSTYLTEVEAGVPNGAIVSYVIFQGSDIEGGTGTYTSAGRTLTRTVTFSKIGGTAGTTKVSVDTTAAIRFIQLAADIVPIKRLITAGAGLTGGGNLTADLTLAVGAGTGITVNADDVALDTGSTRNTDHTAVTLTAGAGLTGGGDISASRSFAVGAG